MARRYVAETTYSSREDHLQRVTIFPSQINKKQLEKELGPLTAKKGILINKNNNWRYEPID